MDNKAARAIASITPFKQLPQNAIDEVLEEARVKVYPPGEYVFKQGDNSRKRLYIIISGYADVLKTADSGDISLVESRKPHDFLGETVLFTDSEYPVSARAREELKCVLLDAGIIEKLIAGHSEFAGSFTSALLDRMRHMYNDIITGQSFEAYSTETHFFKKKVSEVMSSPVFTCMRKDSVTSIAKIMAGHKVSALVVVDRRNRPVGLVTEANLVEKIISRDIAPYSGIAVEEIMDYNLVTLPVDSSLGTALSFMLRHRVDHLAVTMDETLAGLVTTADLVKARSTGSIFMSHDIEFARDMEELVTAGRAVDNLLSGLVAEKAPVAEILEIITEFHDQMIVRVIRFCEEEMVREGLGPPPAPYCWLNMGSPGRKEQTLRTDQDNAIVFGSSDDVEKTRDYFLKMSGKIVEYLALCGFARCPGDVMASNPKWCRSLDEWKETAGNWIKKVQTEPEFVRNLTVFLDFRPVHGSRDLAMALRSAVFDYFRRFEQAVYFLVQDESMFRVPVSIFGSLIPEKTGIHKNEINLKNSACIHITNCIRIFAMKYGVNQTSTLGRVSELTRVGALDSDEADYAVAAFETVMMFRIRENLKKMRQGLKADNYIDPAVLSRRERILLKDAFLAIARLQKITQKKIGAPILS